MQVVGQKRFCVMTTGRTGSTALMDEIAADAGVAVPARQVECRDHELLHPRHALRYAKEYARLSGTPVNGETKLINIFFDTNHASPYVGFKSMPNRHKSPSAFLVRSDIQFIVLLRDDIVATAASFLLAMTQNTWRRNGGTPEQRVTFRPEHRHMVLDNLGYLHASRQLLLRAPGAIRLSYEALCDPGFHDPQLDRLFGRVVRLPDPKPPTRADSYVANHRSFSNFVERAWRKLEQGVNH